MELPMQQPINCAGWPGRPSHLKGTQITYAASLQVTNLKGGKSQGAGPLSSCLYKTFSKEAMPPPS